jgi:hypothetical protein
MKETSPTFQLERFIHERKQLTLGQRQEARRKLEDLAKTGLGVERLPTQNLAQALANSFYARISPTFLNQSNLGNIFAGHSEFSGKPNYLQINIPKFGVYSLDNPTMELFLYKDIFGYSFRVRSPSNLPRVLRQNLVFATEFGKDPRKDLWVHGEEQESWRPNPSFLGFCKKEKRFPREIKYNYSLSSSFYGFIPQETKAELAEASTIFGKSIFLVAETKPEDWTLQKTPKPKVVQDPLLVGVIQDKCYLIDHFDTTPVEDYARKEFLDD